MHVFYAAMPAERQQAQRASQPERYEPLPPVAELPAYVWRRLPRAARIGVAALPFVAIALVLLLGPGISNTKHERAQSEAQRLAKIREQRTAELQAEAKPRFERSTAVAPVTAPAKEQLAARGRVLDEARGSVLADARQRAAAGQLKGPIRRVECEPFPRTVNPSGAEADLGRRFGNYACLAVTAEFGGSAAQEASHIGHPYRMRVDFNSGRYAFCKVSGRAGEGAIQDKPLAAVPHACGGH